MPLSESEMGLLMGMDAEFAVEPEVLNIELVEVPIATQPRSMFELELDIMEAEQSGSLNGGEVERARSFTEVLYMREDADHIVAELPRRSDNETKQEYVLLRFPALGATD